MANVVLDTNIYGKLAKDIDGERLIEVLIRKDTFTIHNFKIIRDELRRASSNILAIYDRLVKTKMTSDTIDIDRLANEYLKIYRELGGHRGAQDIIKDFKIVAYASIKNCDIVFSDDEKTLKHPTAVAAYKIINLRKNLRTPSFYTYATLKKSML